VVGRARTWSIVAALSGAAFAFLLWSVLAHSGLTLADQDIATFIAGHRVSWLTPAVQLVTWLGSTFFIIPFGLVVGGVLWRRRGTWRPFAMTAAALLGAAGLYDIVKPAVSRARPPAALQVGGPEIGRSFPSGHSTQSIAFYGMLAIVLIMCAPAIRRWIFAIGAALVILVVGASRLYLGVHWLTDVLGGYALGLTWVAVVMITSQMLESRRQRPPRGHE
jgi:membrane-associated phospholipid phosphatase